MSRRKTEDENSDDAGYLRRKNAPKPQKNLEIHTDDEGTANLNKKQANQLNTERNS